MREKTRKLIITFPTPTGAMAFEKRCRECKMPGRMIPVPRELSAGCGMAWCAEPSDRELLEELIAERALHIQSVQVIKA